MTGFRDALRTLGSAQKTNKGSPAYSRYVNRPLGRFFAAGGYVLGRTPNQVTAVSALCTFSGIALIALVEPSAPTSIGAALLLVLGYALDAADGQLARLQGGGSTAGEWLDHTVDAIKISVLHLAVLISMYRFGDESDARLLVPLGFQVVTSVHFFVQILMDQMRRAHRNTTEMRLQGDGTSSPIYSLAVLPTDYGLLCIVLGLMAWTNLFFYSYTVLLIAYFGFMCLALPKWYREVRNFG